MYAFFSECCAWKLKTKSVRKKLLDKINIHICVNISLFDPLPFIQSCRCITSVCLLIKRMLHDVSQSKPQSNKLHLYSPSSITSADKRGFSDAPKWVKKCPPRHFTFYWCTEKCCQCCVSLHATSSELLLVWRMQSRQRLPHAFVNYTISSCSSDCTPMKTICQAFILKVRFGTNPRCCG